MRWCERSGVNPDLVHSNIMKNVQHVTERKQLPENPKQLLHTIFLEIISATDVKIAKTIDDLFNDLLYGNTIFLLDGVDMVLNINTAGWEGRQIEEPITEGVIRGPREGFVENLLTNMMLVRRHIRDPNLRFDKHSIGKRSKKYMIVSYVEGIVHPELLQEIKRRLQTIDMDDAPDTGYIEEWLQDSFLSPFPQITNTERPDKVSSALLQGKVAILLDGTPFVLIAPATFGNALQSPEDYYERFVIATFIRLLRYLAAFIAIFMPALYIALLSYQPGMLPTNLTISIAAAREGVPFPPFVEAIMMVITMELLREAGARLPKTIGQTIGIVGGLVIGDAAVSAGIVSPVMVVIIALNAVASFAIPEYSLGISFRIILLGFMIAAGLLGIYGIILAYIMVNIHIVNLKSVGVPYSAPFGPFFKGDWNDLVMRAPLQTINRRPVYMQTKDDKSGNKGE
ncbi:spore germination protein [Virgibacillus sp. 179-BFC.A HS]|uniref:Spore germination protein n=1 Tax=Tigheibacillus jepli TaxID=3035914 RepID=A0ABU5CJ68_9BACI|nr:spore germination protein [Virgibacillus sp. 179-BFC.A HS]MDY0405854.1 spore germination protein [Virgibacillus sp. 179-BFC.A HS]